MDSEGNDVISQPTGDQADTYNSADILKKEKTNFFVKVKKTSNAEKASKKFEEGAKSFGARVKAAWGKFVAWLKQAGAWAKQHWVPCVAAVGGVAMLALVIVGAVMLANRGKEEVLESERVVLDYKPDGYGENVSASTIAGIFSGKISDRLASDQGYNTTDAVRDYEEAYAESTGDVRLYVQENKSPQGPHAEEHD